VDEVRRDRATRDVLNGLSPFAAPTPAELSMVQHLARLAAERDYRILLATREITNPKPVEEKKP
jgi:hypothetical protein